MPPLTWRHNSDQYIACCCFSPLNDLPSPQSVYPHPSPALTINPLLWRWATLSSLQRASNLLPVATGLTFYPACVRPKCQNKVLTQSRHVVSFILLTWWIFFLSAGHKLNLWIITRCHHHKVATYLRTGVCSLSVSRPSRGPLGEPDGRKGGGGGNGWQQHRARG